MKKLLLLFVILSYILNTAVPSYLSSIALAKEDALRPMAQQLLELKASSPGATTPLKLYGQAWENFCQADRMCRTFPRSDGKGKPDEDYIYAVMARTFTIRDLIDARKAAVKEAVDAGLREVEAIAVNLEVLLMGVEAFSGFVEQEKRNIRRQIEKALSGLGKSSSPGKQGPASRKVSGFKRRKPLKISRHSLLDRIRAGDFNTDFREQLELFGNLVLGVANEVLLPARLEAMSPDEISLKTETTGPESWLTKHDTDAQDRLVDAIHREYPEWRFFVEEHSGINIDPALLDDGIAEFVCIIDPIDGTGEFARGTEKNYADTDFRPLYYKKFLEFGTGVSLFRRNPKTRLLEPLIAVGLLPELVMDERDFSLVEAVVDIEGAFLNGSEIKVQRVRKREASSKMGIVEDRRQHSDYALALAEKFEKTFLNVSSLAHFSMIAAGNKNNHGCSALMLARPCIWDAVIGGFIAQKAGARVKLFNKRDLFPVDLSMMDAEFRLPSVIAIAPGLEQVVFSVIDEVCDSLAWDPAYIKAVTTGKLRKNADTQAAIDSAA